jgi:hypothetical protein
MRGGAVWLREGERRGGERKEGGQGKARGANMSIGSGHHNTLPCHWAGVMINTKSLFPASNKSL